MTDLFASSLPIETMSWINVGSFGFKMVLTVLFNYGFTFGGSPGIEAQFSLGLQPADYTFAIWGLINLLLSVYTVYQALPAEQVTTRNNELITQIGWMWSANMLLNSIWLPAFLSNTTTGFVLSGFIIIPMLLSALLMSKLTVDAKLDLVETIGLKWGMSVYSGWLTAASILNTAVVLKITGIADGWNERFWSILMLWVALMIYIGNAWLDSDPVYAATYIWALMGIKAKNDD